MDTALEAALDFLRPVPCPVQLVRVGGKADGAYLLPADLGNIVKCLSPGVGNSLAFEQHLSRRHHIKCSLMDGSVSQAEIENQLDPIMHQFSSMHLSAVNSAETKSLDTWAGEESQKKDGDLILQMDIEGAEYECLLASSDKTLGKFRIIALELHNLEELQVPGAKRTMMIECLEKLSRQFRTVYVRANNCCGEIPKHPHNLKLPRVLEITLLRKDRFGPRSRNLWWVHTSPHVLDVFLNMPSRAPLFLDETIMGPRDAIGRLMVFRNLLAWHLRNRLKLLADLFLPSNS